MGWVVGVTHHQYWHRLRLGHTVWYGLSRFTGFTGHERSGGSSFDFDFDLELDIILVEILKLLRPLPLHTAEYSRF